MALALRDYNKFYSTKHGNRVLSWAHYLGTATFISHFPKGTKELSVSLYQATVLLLFNEKTSWKADEIQEATGLSDNDLALTLQSLALGKKRVLTKNGSAGKAIEKEDLFTFNAEFTDTKYKVHVNSIQQKESVSFIPLSFTLLASSPSFGNSSVMTCTYEFNDNRQKKLSTRPRSLTSVAKPRSMLQLFAL